MGVSITYLANEGVLLSSGAPRVLLDRLFRSYGPEYALPADSTQAALAYWVLTNHEGREIVRRWIRPRQVVAIHVPPGDQWKSSAMRRPRSLAPRSDAIAAIAPVVSDGAARRQMRFGPTRIEPRPFRDIGGTFSRMLSFALA